MVRRMKCAECCVQQQKISSTDSEICKGALWHKYYSTTNPVLVCFAIGEKFYDHEDD